MFNADSQLMEKWSPVLEHTGAPEIQDRYKKAVFSDVTVTEDLVYSSAEVYDAFNLPFEFLFCDATTLKTMIRANPGVMVLDKGTVVQKKHWTDIDEIKL